MTGIWGKFSGGQGGLEGRNPSPKEGFLRLQGLPSPSKVFLPPSVIKLVRTDAEFEDAVATDPVGG